MRDKVKSTFSNRFFQVGVCLLLVICAVVALVSINATHAAPANTAASKGSPYSLSIQHATSSVQTRVSQMKKIFSYSYPKIVKRFALDPAKVAKKVTFKFDSKYDGFAETSGTVITGNTSQVKNSPNGMGWFAHELTHVVQAYKINCGTSNSSWFTEAMATYGDWSYSPNGDGVIFQDPGAPTSADSYKDGYGVGARFLVWVEKHYSSKIVDKVNHGCQTGKQASTTFKSVTGKTVDQLWKAYRADKKFKIALPLNR